MKQMPWVILAVGVAALLAVGFLVYQNLGPQTGSVSLMEDGIMVAPPAEVVDPQTGEVDEAQFQTQQAVSQEDSLQTLEAELDQTVILEEDFSNL